VHVLLVEDDPLLGEGLQTALRRSAVTVDWLQDGAAARDALRGRRFDIVLLDLGLPRLDGLELVRQLRRAGDDVPILVMTARDRVAERVQGLDSGADDYLVKPFETAELLARLRALHRRRTGRGTPRMEHGDIVLDPAAMLVTRGGRLVELPRREFALLSLLLENTGRVVTRAQAQQQLYGWDEDVESNTLDSLVHHLRRKLGSDLIRTVRGVGYAIEAAADSPPIAAD
jgi:DNA-binding response OmpR family regulator